jgi:hypothetical protein
MKTFQNYPTYSRRIQRTRFFDEKRTIRPPIVEEDEDDTPGRLCWGAPNDIPEPEFAPTVAFEVITKEEESWVEWDRESDTVKIENPEDSEDWVEVDRAKKLQYRKTATATPYEGNSSSTSTDFSNYTEKEQESFVLASTPKTKRSNVKVTLMNGPSSA